MFRITAPHFCAGVIFFEGRVTKTAPILSYMLGWDREKVQTYCKKKGWELGWVLELDEQADLESQ